MAKLPVKSGSLDRSKTVAKLKELLANKQSDLAWHHEVGRLVNQIEPERSYGNAGIPQLAEQLGKAKNLNFIYKVLDFARQYDERDLPTLDGLKFGHVIPLLSVEDDKLRDEFRQQCQQNGWSTAQLGAAVKERQGKRSHGGRPPKDPTNIGPRTALSTIVDLSDRWQRQCVPALEQNLTELAKRLKQKSEEELLKLVGEACTAMCELQAAVKNSLEELQGIKASRKIPRRRTRN